MKHSLMLAYLCLSLAGCATSPSDHLRDYQGTSFGYVVASVGREKAVLYSSIGVSFQQRGTADRGTLAYAPKLLFKASPTDFDSATSEGSVILKRLPPGNYELVSVGGLWHAGPSSFPQTKPISPPISFSIEVGKVSYLGRYVIGREGFGPNGVPTIKVTNEASSDLAVIKSREPSASLESPLSFVPRMIDDKL